MPTPLSFRASLATRLLSTTPSSGSSAPPPPAPSRGPRIIPLALLGAAVAASYRVVTDADTRAALEAAVPASKTILDQLPTLSKEEEPRVSVRVKEQVDKPTEVKAAGKGVDIAEKVEKVHSEMKDSIKAQPSDKEANKEQEKSDVSLPTKEEMVKTAEKIVKVEPEPVKEAMRKEMLTDIFAAGNEDKESSDMKGGSGKHKLQRILGKSRGDVGNEKDVVDDTEFRKPGKAGVKEETTKRGGWGGGWKKPSGKKFEVNSIKEKVEGGKLDVLKSELESQVKWEAVRLQEAVRAQRVADLKEMAMEKKMAEERLQEEVARVRTEVMRDAELLMAKRTKEMEEKTRREGREDVERMMIVREEEMRERIAAEFAEKERVGSMTRSKELVEAKAEMEAVLGRFDEVVKQTEMSKTAAERTRMAFLLKDMVSRGKPLGEVANVVGAGSELGKVVADSIPKKAIGAGVESWDRLKEDFVYASRKGLSVAMVPEGKTGTVWGHLVGSIFSRLKIPVERWEDGYVGSGNEGRIRQAGRMVERGDVKGAIECLQGLGGLSRDVMMDWMERATGKVAAEMAADVLIADAVVAQISGQSE